MHSLLTDPLIRMDKTDGSRVKASLPEVYAALMADKVEAFPALRPHQRHAWHAFLVQLGAMAMHKAGLDEPPSDADEWHRITRALTPDWPNDEPWHLVVDDITKPAFMQPPASSPDKLDEYVYEFKKSKKTNSKKPTLNTPDELDMLVTSKNHDIKTSVGGQCDLDDWMFALVTLQTMEGYGGSGKHGISRMPSGYGNRPAFSITPSIRLGVHAWRDMMALLENRHRVVDDYEYPPGDGIKLLWTIVWDGKRSESCRRNQMDPLYIEICRRVRLRWHSNRMDAVCTTSEKKEGKRIVDAKGLTGDPWAPVGKSPNQRGTPPAFLGSRKFGYERVIDGLTSPDWKPPYLLQPMQAERNKEVQLVARGMIRGEGGTSGYHERLIPLKPKVVRVFGGAGGLEELGHIARERIEQVGTVKNILRHAVATFAANGDSDFRAHRNGQPSPNQLAQPFANKLDEIVDSRFFEHLQDEFDTDEIERDAIRKKWLMNGSDGVVDQADKILKAAEDTLPCLSIQKFKARVRTDGVFWGRLCGNDGLPFLFESQEEGETWQSSDQTKQRQNQAEG